MLDIMVPSPGESITEVTLGQWHKHDGDWVETDEVLVDIESDKATLEVRAPAAGVLRVKVQSGAEQKVGAPIGSIDTAAAKPAGSALAAFAWALGMCAAGGAIASWVHECPWGAEIRIASAANSARSARPQAAEHMRREAA